MSDTPEAIKKFNMHRLLASFIVIVGALLILLSADTNKEIGIYVVVFGITYSFVTRLRVWLYNRGTTK